MPEKKTKKPKQKKPQKQKQKQKQSQQVIVNIGSSGRATRQKAEPKQNPVAQIQQPVVQYLYRDNLALNLLNEQNRVAAARPPAAAAAAAAAPAAVPPAPVPPAPAAPAAPIRPVRIRRPPAVRRPAPVAAPRQQQQADDDEDANDDEVQAPAAPLMLEDAPPQPPAPLMLEDARPEPPRLPQPFVNRLMNNNDFMFRVANIPINQARPVNAFDQALVVRNNNPPPRPPPPPMLMIEDAPRPPPMLMIEDAPRPPPEPMNNNNDDANQKADVAEDEEEYVFFKPNRKGNPNDELRVKWWREATNVKQTKNNIPRRNSKLFYNYMESVISKIPRDQRTRPEEEAFQYYQNVKDILDHNRKDF